MQDIIFIFNLESTMKSIGSTLILMIFITHSLALEILAEKFTLQQLPIQTSHYQCVRQQQGDLISWLLQIENGIDEVQRQSFYNAKNVGFKMDIAFIPCRTTSPQASVQQFLRNVGKNSFGMVWVYPIQYQSYCPWKFPVEDNCAYLAQIVLLLRLQGYRVGVRADSDFWQILFGSRSSCSKLTNFPLAWVPSEKQQDGKPSFDNYKPIGGWQHPFMKQYSVKTICGRLYYLNYYE